VPGVCLFNVYGQGTCACRSLTSGDDTRESLSNELEDRRIDLLSNLVARMYFADLSQLRRFRA
jgi:hypothetical protein